MQTESGFGVVLIRSGQEAMADKNTQQPKVYEVGTLARINDFDRLSDGLLGIAAEGHKKFTISEVFEREDHLLMAAVEYSPEEPAVPFEEGSDELREVLRELIKHPMVIKMKLEIDFEDARSVGWRLAQLLPIEQEVKQSLLQIQSPQERLGELLNIVEHLRT
jgi:Lon protease-like protein